MERNKTEQNMTYETPLDPLSDAEFDDALSKTLSAAVSSRQKASFSSTEDFADWLRQGEQKRKQRRCRRIVYILAAAAAVFAFAIYLCTSCFETVLPASILLPWDSTPTYADSDTENNITEENGSIVIGGDGNGNVGEWKATFTSYDDLPLRYQSEFIWFAFLPDDYDIYKIKIKENYRTREYDTIFKKKQGQTLIIRQVISLEKTVGPKIINHYDDIILINGKDIYFKGNSESNVYMFIEEKNLIHVIDSEKMDVQKIEAMIASIKTGQNNK